MLNITKVKYVTPITLVVHFRDLREMKIIRIEQLKSQKAII